MSVAKKISRVLGSLDAPPSQLAADAGVSYNSMQKLLSGDVDTIRGMRLETVETALNSMGYKLIVREK